MSGCGPASLSSLRVISRSQGRADGASADRAGGAQRPLRLVIRPDDTVERRAVEVAAVQDGIAVVTKGLSPGERIVVEGQYRLTNGSRVKPVHPSRARASPEFLHIMTHPTRCKGNSG